ncbi:MAG: hypothetical protein ABI162_18885 [Luteolibacter sp.]
MAKLSLNQAYEYARECHRRGALDEAVGVARQILSIDSKHWQALVLMGTIAGQKGRDEIALKHFKTAVKIQPGLSGRPTESRRGIPASWPNQGRDFSI